MFSPHEAIPQFLPGGTESVPSYIGSLAACKALGANRLRSRRRTTEFRATGIDSCRGSDSTIWHRRIGYEAGPSALHLQAGGAGADAQRQGCDRRVPRVDESFL